MNTLTRTTQQFKPDKLSSTIKERLSSVQKGIEEIRQYLYTTGQTNVAAKIGHLNAKISMLSLNEIAELSATVRSAEIKLNGIYE